MYFENYEVGSNDYKRLIADFKNPKKNIECYIKIALVKDNEYGFEQYDITVVSAPTKEFVNTYLNGKYYVGSKRNHIELGCDTARFSIEIDGRHLTFHTGADGYYGDVIKYSYNGAGNIGCVISLSLSADMFSFEELEGDFKYLFCEDAS